MKNELIAAYNEALQHGDLDDFRRRFENARLGIFNEASTWSRVGTTPKFIETDSGIFLAVTSPEGAYYLLPLLGVKSPHKSQLKACYDLDEQSGNEFSVRQMVSPAICRKGYVDLKKIDLTSSTSCGDQDFTFTLDKLAKRLLMDPKTLAGLIADETLAAKLAEEAPFPRKPYSANLENGLRLKNCWELTEKGSLVIATPKY